MTKTLQDYLAIHTRACTAVMKADRTLTPDVDAFWPLYLQAVFGLDDVPVHDLPRRAVQFRVDVGADDLRALSSTLFNLSNRIAAGELSSHSVSGGYDAGYEHWMTVAEQPTHDEYVAQLNAWLKARKTEVKPDPAAVCLPSFRPNGGVTGSFHVFELGYRARRGLLPAVALTDAARDILAERQRHIDVEGWTPAHDDEHGPGALALAAAAYALDAGEVLDLFSPADAADRHEPLFWPFSSHWWKPGAPRRNLVKAASLILAEIERIDRDPGDESGRHHTGGRDHA